MNAGTLRFQDRQYPLDSAGLELNTRRTRAGEFRSIFVYAGREDGFGVGFGTDELPVRANLTRDDLEKAVLHRSWGEIFSDDTISLEDHEALEAAQFNAPTADGGTAIAMFDTLRLTIQSKGEDSYQVDMEAQIWFVEDMDTKLPMTASFLATLKVNCTST